MLKIKLRMKNLQKIFLLQFLFLFNPITPLQASYRDSDSDGEEIASPDYSATFDDNWDLKKYPWTPLHFAINRLDIKEVTNIVTNQNFKPQLKKYHRGETPLDLAIHGMQNKNYHTTTREKYKTIADILLENKLTISNCYEKSPVTLSTNK